MVTVGDPVESICCQFGNGDLVIVTHDNSDDKSKCWVDKVCALINVLCLVYCLLVLRHRLSIISVAEQCPARPPVVWTYC